MDNQVRIGIDPSIHSTGISILQPNQPAKYFIITDKLTKKQARIKSELMRYMRFEYSPDITTNITQIAAIIAQIIELYKGFPSLRVRIEDIALGAKGSRSTIDLALLNGAIRQAVYDLTGIKIQPVNICHWKKLAVGNGHADKELVKDAWRRLEPDMYELLKEVKSDDISDSFFIANFEEEKEEKEEAVVDIPNDTK